jgi:hypothetical protein
MASANESLVLSNPSAGFPTAEALRLERIERFCELRLRLEP